MVTDQPLGDENPQVIGAEAVYFFEGTAIVPPTGTVPPPRPTGMQHTPLQSGTIRDWEYIEAEGMAVIPPPGTMPPPRPPGKERMPTAQPQPEVAALVARIESALEVIHAALAEIKRIQSQPQPQSKAS